MDPWGARGRVVSVGSSESGVTDGEADAVGVTLTATGTVLVVVAGVVM